MALIKISTLCASLFLCMFIGEQSAFANSQIFSNDTITQETTHNMTTVVKSPITLASTDFSFDTIEEAEGRLLVRGRKGIRPRRVSYRY